MKPLFTAARRLCKAPLLWALAIPFIRRRVAFEIGFRHFGELGISVPVGEGLICPLGTRDAVYSFSEIFVEAEYGDFLNRLPLPDRWIDVGCHAGYFTLHLAREHRRRGTDATWSALMIEPDPRMRGPVDQLVRINRLADRCEFVAGAVCASGDTTVGFALSDGMGSSLASVEGTPGGMTVPVPTLPEAEILRRFPPPYDLVKLDIEGAEWEFLDCYRELLRNSRSLLLEWHLPGRGTDGESRVRTALDELGFDSFTRLRDHRVVSVGSGHLTSGVCLAGRTGTADANSRAR